MGNRKRIGIYFTYNENWIGGSYYITNIVEALKTLDGASQPILVFISHSHEELDLLKNIQYPFSQYVLIGKNQPKEYVKKIITRLTKNKFRITSKGKINSLDFIFPYLPIEELKKIKNKINWIPDFQEMYLPHFFEEKEIQARRNNYVRIAQKEKQVVFSSNDALQDFNKFFPNSSVETFVINFAVTHDQDFKKIDIEELKKKYAIQLPFLISPNQFWAHKNHIVILKALKILKDKNLLHFQMVFTGKESDYRNPDYFESLKKYVKENNLENEIRFLGFIDRKDQLQLMNAALCVIQPSLFEGWSTVVEDAKSMGKTVIASNINVHKEQLGDLAYFFNPEDEQDLVNNIIRSLEENKTQYKIDYKENIKKFAKDFIKMIDKIAEN